MAGAPRSRRVAERGRRLLFALVAQLLVLGGAELVLRALPPPPAPAITLPFGRLPREIVQDDVLGWRLASGVRPANDERRRWAARWGVTLSPEPELPISPDGHRDQPLAERGDRPLVLAVGDSSVYGEGVLWHETFAQQLERRLQGTVAVQNLGVPGYSTWQALHSALELASLKPAAVIVYVNSDRAATSGGTDGAWFRRPGRGLAVQLGGLRIFRWVQALVDPVVKPGADAGKRVRVPLSDHHQALAAWADAVHSGPLAGTKLVFVSPGLQSDLRRLDPLLGAGAGPPEWTSLLANASEHGGDPRAYHAALGLAANREQWGFVGGAALFHARCLEHDCAKDHGPFVDELHPSKVGHGWLAEALEAPVRLATGR